MTYSKDDVPRMTDDERTSRVMLEARKTGTWFREMERDFEDVLNTLGDEADGGEVPGEVITKELMKVVNEALDTLRCEMRENTKKGLLVTGDDVRLFLLEATER